jgi:hypothetical protein
LDYLLETSWYRSPIKCWEKVKNIPTYRLFNIFKQNVQKPIEKEIDNGETNRFSNIFKQNVKKPIEKDVNTIETYRPPPPMIQILEENVQIGKKNYYLNLKVNRCKK